MKPLASGLWFHLSFEHFDVISKVHKSTDEEKQGLLVVYFAS